MNDRSHGRPVASTLLAPAAHRIMLPTPWAVGSVNVYLIDDEPLTLVDTGPRSAEALDALEAGLAKAGRGVEELERIVLTHQHLDHWGMAADLVARSGAELCALQPLAGWLAAFPDGQAADDELGSATMRRHGVPEAAIEAVLSGHRSARRFAAPAMLTRTLVDGEVLHFSRRRLRVHHRPGHSPSDTVLSDEDRGVVLVGDHVLAHMASKPILAVPLGNHPDDAEPRPLTDYIASLTQTRDMPADVLLPGHGVPVRGHRALIEGRLRHYEERAARVAELLANGPRSAGALAAQMWPRVAPEQVSFPLFETLGYLDRLRDAGAARELPLPGGGVEFELS